MTAITARRSAETAPFARWNLMAAALLSDHGSILSLRPATPRVCYIGEGLSVAVCLLPTQAVMLGLDAMAAMAMQMSCAVGMFNISRLRAGQKCGSSTTRRGHPPAKVLLVFVAPFRVTVSLAARRLVEGSGTAPPTVPETRPTVPAAI